MASKYKEGPLTTAEIAQLTDLVQSLSFMEISKIMVRGPFELSKFCKDNKISTKKLSQSALKKKRIIPEPPRPQIGEVPHIEKKQKSHFQKGGFSDEEKRKMERLVDFNTFAEIARQLNRNPASVRKYLQRNGLAKDLVSAKKSVEDKAKNNHHFATLKEQLTEDEFKFSVQVYKGMMEQFGNDVLYSEEVQIVEYCMVTCLLNRTFVREMQINQMIKEQQALRAQIEKMKDDLISKKGDEEDDDDESIYDQEDEYVDKMERIDVRIAEMNIEFRDVKKNQINFLDSKEKITKALQASRGQRSNELVRANQNFGDLVIYLKKSEDFRKNVGLEIEKMKLGVREEYIRLSELHLFADNQYDYPIYNSQVVKFERDKPEGIIGASIGGDEEIDPEQSLELIEGAP